MKILAIFILVVIYLILFWVLPFLAIRDLSDSLKVSFLIHGGVMIALFLAFLLAWAVTILFQ